MPKWIDKLLCLFLAASAGVAASSLHFRPTREARLLAAPLPVGFGRPPALDRMIPAASYDGTFESIVDRMAMAARANVVVRWQSFEAEGMELKPTDRTRIELGTMSLEESLRSLVRSKDRLNSSESEVTWDPNGTIYLETRYESCRASFVRFYDVDDLLESWSKKYPMDTTTLAPAYKDVYFDLLCQLVEENVDTDSWRDNGGQIGSVFDLNYVLVVEQSARNLETTDRLLIYLHSPAGIQEIDEMEHASTQVDPSTQPTRMFKLRHFR